MSTVINSLEVMEKGTDNLRTALESHEQLLTLKSGKPSKPLTPPPKQLNWRYEFKYIVPRYLRTPLTVDLRRFAAFDGFAPNGGFYNVRSLYLDSPDWMCVYEKSAGVSERCKLRIRGYLDQQNHVTSVKFEVKHRRDVKIAKTTACVDTETYRGLLPAVRDNRAPDLNIIKESPALCEFFRIKRLYNMKPVTNIQFRRQAFVSRADRTVRVTFDDRLVAAAGLDLFAPVNHSKPLLLPELAVLEIKLEGRMPFWLQRLINKYSLKSQAVSKYVRGAVAGPFGLDGIS